MAGLLEGEGSFLKPPPSQPRTISISVQMTDSDIIARIAKVFGVSFCKCRPQASHHRSSFRVSVSGRKAAMWMVRLRPLMGVRRQGQIDAALACHNPKVTRLTPELRREIVRRFQAGEKAPAVAKEFGIAREYVYRLVKKYGGISQLEKAPDCGSGFGGFDSRISPQN